MDCPAFSATCRAACPPADRKQETRRPPRGSRRVSEGLKPLWRAPAAVETEAAGEQAENDQDDPDQGVSEHKRNNPENDQQSASTEVHSAPPFLRNPGGPSLNSP